MADPVAKRHHTVPKFYLRGFADENDQIATVPLSGEKPFTRSITKTATENHFYSLPGHPDGDDAFEKALSQLEGATARIIEEIKRGVWPLSPADRFTLGEFIAMQVARSPVQRRNSEQLAADMARMEIGLGGKENVKGWAKRKWGRDLTDQEAEQVWKQATQPDGPPITLARPDLIEHMAKVAGGLTKYIVGRPWLLLRFDRRSLITSDDPVGLAAHPEDEDAAWMGTGFMTAWGITFPLTRKLGLVASDPMAVADLVPVEVLHAGEGDRVEFGTTAYEKFITQHTAGGASLWLYRHPDDEKFVPHPLPNPRPHSMRMRGGFRDIEFTGESMLHMLPQMPDLGGGEDDLEEQDGFA
ncbi:MAG TPA: DUF4238 domain-containing protein [Terrimesophilobacter sp.]|nr:DUF4238 domain-containing protein [Terrimesophilobacter sp.]